MTLEDIRSHFDVSHRTAQRMTDALQQAFPHAVEIKTDAERRRRWRLAQIPLAALALTGDAELAALELAIARLSDDGDLLQVQTLKTLRNRLLAALPERDARRAEADAGPGKRCDLGHTAQALRVRA